MKRPYYIFSAGKLQRKDNTIFFVPYKSIQDDTRTENNAPEKDNESAGEETLTKTGELDGSYNSKGKRVIPIEDVASFYIFGDINFNSRFLQFLNRYHIPVHIFNYYGYYSGSYYPNEFLLSGFVLVDQVSHYKSPKKRITLAQKIIDGASWNMLRNLKYYARRLDQLDYCIESIEALRNQIVHTHDVEELMGIEGNIRQTYYASFETILGDKFDFNHRVKNPPDNAVNALISFGNAMVYSTCLNEIFKTQLSPLVSFLHQPGERRYSLALDLAEIFKPLFADRVLFTCLNQQRIKERNFDKNLNYCYLTEKGRKTFVQAYEEKMKTTIEHRKLKRKVSYRRLVRLECYKLVKHLSGAEEYEPFKAWW
jgi:CRISPR-associated protein Cas1